MSTPSIHFDIVPDIYCNSRGRPSLVKVLISKTVIRCCVYILFNPDPFWNRYRHLNNYRLIRGCYNMLERCFKMLVRIVYYVCKYLLKKFKPTDEAYQAYVNELAQQILENNKAEDVFKALNTKAYLGYVHNSYEAQRMLIRELFNRFLGQYLETPHPEPVAIVRLTYYCCWGGHGRKQENDIYEQYIKKMKSVDAYATSAILQRIDFFDPLDTRDEAVKRRDVAQKRAQFFKTCAEEQLAFLQVYCVQMRSQLASIGLDGGSIPQCIIQYADEALERIFIYIRQTTYPNAEYRVDSTLYYPMMEALARFCIDHPDYRDLSKAKELLTYLPENKQNVLIRAMQAYSSGWEISDLFHKIDNKFQDGQQQIDAMIVDDQASSDAVIAACQQVDQEKREEKKS